MEFKKFIIDVDENTQEKAVYYGDDFVCFEDDIDSLLTKLNELNGEVATLRVKNIGLETDIRRLHDKELRLSIHLLNAEKIGTSVRNHIEKEGSINQEDYELLVDGWYDELLSELKKL